MARANMLEKEAQESCLSKIDFEAIVSE